MEKPNITATTILIAAVHYELLAVRRWVYVSCAFFKTHLILTPTLCIRHYYLQFTDEKNEDQR